MPRILLLFAHPALEKSRVHRRMLHHARQVLGLSHDDMASLHDAAYVAQQSGVSRNLRRPIGLTDAAA